MSLKLKVLGLGLLAIMATSAFAVVNAGADTGGHFTNDASNGHALIVGTESGAHQLHFVREGSGEGEAINCINDSYTGTVNAATVTEITVTPAWSTCRTGTSTTHFEIDENECDFKFTIGDTGTHHTVDFVCPVGKSLEITHQNCTIRVPSQSVLAAVYTSTTELTKHAITMDVTGKKITSHYESGICIFLGTTQSSEMTGSVTVRGTDTVGNPVNITATTK